MIQADKNVISNLETIGRLYREMIQVYDDRNDTMAVPANPDWLQERKRFSILFAVSVEHQDRARFIELHEDISGGNALQEAQEIMIRCGAVSYCVDRLLRRYQISQELLRKTSLAHQAKVESLMEDVIAPAWKLFEALCLSPNILPTLKRLWNSK